MKHGLRTFLLQSLASLLMAFAIWLIAKQSDMDSTWTTTRIQLRNVPSNVAITVDPTEIQTQLQFPRDLNNSIVGRDFQVAINAHDLFSGDPHTWPSPTQSITKDYKLAPQDLQKLFPIQAAQVLMVNPQSISLTGRLLARNIPIDVRTSNSLPDRLTLTGPLRAEPAQVMVTGTREDLDRATRALTTPVDLSQISSSMQLFPKLILPDGVQLVAGDNFQVTVNIGISERAVRQTISSVPISYLSFSGLTTHVTPNAADVTIEGPASAVAAIGPDDISFTPVRDLPEVLGKRTEVGIEAHLKASVSPEIASQITIRECRPARIAVEFAASAQQNKPSPHP